MNPRRAIKPQPPRGCGRSTSRVPSRGMRYHRGWRGVSPLSTSSRAGSVCGLQQRWLAAAVVAALLLLFGHSAMLRAETHAPHPPHALLSSLGSEVWVNPDHAHLLNGSFAHCHNEFATAVLPRSSTTLVQLGVATVVVAMVAMLASLVAPAGRGPPRALPRPPGGQTLLTRLCVARR